jgi:hypothetical protein
MNIPTCTQYFVQTKGNKNDLELEDDYTFFSEVGIRTVSLGNSFSVKVK